LAESQIVIVDEYQDVNGRLLAIMDKQVGRTTTYIHAMVMYEAVGNDAP
jgi:hypothetical protein